MAERRANCIAHMEKTERLERIIEGNGQPGLIANVQSVIIKVEQLKNTNKIIMTLQMLILGAIVKIIFFGGK